MIFFSVIIPTYNRAHCLKRTLDSLVNQTYKNFEVIVCDDGSSDNTEDIIKSYNTTLNIKYFWDNNWGGPARPRNKGINESSGQWICFLDSDDWWYPRKLEVCFTYIQEYDMIYHIVDLYKDTRAKTSKKIGRDLSSDAFRDLVVNGNGIANSSVLVRKSVIEQVGPLCEDRSFIAAEDYDYWLRISKVTSRIKFVKQSLGGYFWETGNNISSISQKRIDLEQVIFDKYLRDLANESDRKLAKAIFHYKIGRYYGVLKKYELAILNLKQSFSGNYTVKFKSFIFLVYFMFLSLLRKLKQ